MKYGELTKYIEIFTEAKSYGDWYNDEMQNGSDEHPITGGEMHYDKDVIDFKENVAKFAEVNNENYISILEKNGIKNTVIGLIQYGAGNADENCILAMINAVLSFDKKDPGTLYSMLEEGKIVRWLKRLKELDEK